MSPAARGVARFLLGRLAGLVITLLVTSFIVFGGLYLTPGSQLGYLLGGRAASPAVIRQVTAQYHLNESFFSRYGNYLNDLIHGHLGQSLVFKDNVSALLSPRVGTTAMLVIYASLLIVVVGIAVGTLAGLKGGRVDRVITIMTTVGLATPGFVAAIILVSVFAVNLGWFPTFGSGTGFADRLWHLTLPAIALALSGLALVARVTRTSVAAESSREHVETARSRGIGERTIIRRHIVRNAFIPISTVAGLTVGGLIAGSVIVETAFGLNGLGSFLVSSVNAKDYSVVQAITLVLVGAFVLVNTLVDVLYVAIDPRVRPWAAA
jgi:peptide/nickel transport system permease protein